MGVGLIATGVTASAGQISSGMIAAYGGSNAPSGWLLCDGTSYATSAYSNLYSAIGTNYGSSGSGFFNVPDCRSRVPVGYNANDGNFNAMNYKDGNSTVTLDGNTLTSHNHGTQDGGHAHNVYDPGHGHNMSASTHQVEQNNQQANTAITSFGQTDQRGGFTNQSGTGVNIYGNYAGLQGLYQTGGGAAHNNLQPYLTVQYIIKT